MGRNKLHSPGQRKQDLHLNDQPNFLPTGVGIAIFFFKTKLLLRPRKRYTLKSVLFISLWNNLLCWLGHEAMRPKE